MVPFKASPFPPPFYPPRLVFPDTFLGSPVRRPRREIAIAGVRADFRGCQNILSKGATNGPEQSSNLPRRSAASQIPRALANAGDLSDRGGDAFCARKKGAKVLGSEPATCARDSAFQRDESERDKYSASVRAIRPNCEKRTTP